MVTPKEEREVIFPVWLTSFFTVFALLLAIAVGAILYFKSPASIRTSPNEAHNIPAPSDKTNAPHFSPTRNLQQPQAPAGPVDGRLMAPGRTLPQPGASQDYSNAPPAGSPGGQLTSPGDSPDQTNINPNTTPTPNNTQPGGRP